MPCSLQALLFPALVACSTDTNFHSVSTASEQTLGMEGLWIRLVKYKFVYLINATSSFPSPLGTLTEPYS